MIHVVGRQPVRRVPVGSRRGPRDLPPTADVAGRSAEQLTKPDGTTAHVPESWSRDDNLLFSVVDGLAASLWHLSIRDEKAALFGDVRSTTPLNAELLSIGTVVNWAEELRARVGRD